MGDKGLRGDPGESSKGLRGEKGQPGSPGENSDISGAKGIFKISDGGFENLYAFEINSNGRKKIT